MGAWDCAPGFADRVRVVVSAMLFGVSPQDTIAFTGAVVVLLAAATVAMLLPRAARRWWMRDLC